MEEKKTVLIKLHAYKQKYYKGLLLRGGLFAILSILGLFVLGGLLEYSFWFDTTVRTVLFTVFIVFLLLVVYKTIIVPALFLFGKSGGLSDEIAAKNIGEYYGHIGDKLINYIQLNNSKGNNELISASINQRSERVENFTFSKAIDLRSYLKPAPYVIVALLLISGVNHWMPDLLIESTQRIANFHKNYNPPTLFAFSVTNSKLVGYKNENFLLSVKTEGSLIPEDVYLILSNRKVKMNSNNAGFFSYEFITPQASSSFYLEAAGVKSPQYVLEILALPSLKGFTTSIAYPKYIKKPRVILNGVGNITVPKGSEVSWNIQSVNTDSILFNFKREDVFVSAQKVGNQSFKHNLLIKESENYEISLYNDHGQSKEKIIYSLEMIEDQFPKIIVENYQDTTLFSYIILNGRISDDYGLRKLKLFYKSKNTSKYKSIPISISPTNPQTYYYKWSIDSLLNQNSDEFSYYLEVWDNDGINGSKSTKTARMNFSLPKRQDIDNMISKSELKSKEDIHNALEQAIELERNIKDAKDKIKGKKELNWQDENKIKEIIEKKNAINEAIQQLKEQNKKSNLQKERFNKQQQGIKEKAELLQKLMDDLLDEETKKLYEELQRLLEDSKDVNEIQDKLGKLDNKEKNLEQELERALELFKRIQLEQKIEEVINELEKNSDNQEKLGDDTKDKKNKLEDIQNLQEEISKDKNEIEKKMEELNELNQDLKNPESIPDNKQDLEDIDQTTNDIEEELEKGNRKKGSELQKKASEQMQQLADKMKQMQGGMQMQAMQENLDHLRDVVHSLIKLSFDQESLMGSFRTIDQSDPRFVQLSQTQIKLKDDAKILEDSLLSLASRVFQISSFVTREVSNMNQYMDESSTAIKERQKSQVVSKQQFAMTSMNNLALLLDDVLQQMQQQMADAMGNPKPGDKDGKNLPGMSELQKQLNDKIKALKRGGAKGRQLSEELGKLASEQEQLRKMLEKYQDNPNGSNGDKSVIKDIIKKMEETELDLVNKNITSQTIKRQEEILARLLQSEDALREQEEDEKREGEQARSYDDFLPKAFEEYIKAKEKEIELLKTVPPKLFPHYKNEVNDYFERVNERIEN